MKGYLSSTKTFRYFTKGDPTIANTLVYVLHGYGQLAEFFIRKFSDLGEEYFFVAPEGMHRFYLKGSSGRVGASWMTKEERECDIEDNLNFLDSLHDLMQAEYDLKRIIILGFSQGGATATRWYYNGRTKADNLIIWASVFPPDLNIGEELKQSSNGANGFFIGDQDEFYTSDQQNEQLELYRSKGFESVHYNGKHDISQDVLLPFLKKITADKK
jgi:predicted esterase